MGVYLNSKNPWTLYQEEAKAAYFVDKTDMLEELLEMVEQGSKYICITRPRRFGKTVMANMIASFLSCGVNSQDLLHSLV